MPELEIECDEFLIFDPVTKDFYSVWYALWFERLALVMNITVSEKTIQNEKICVFMINYT